jgi:hypothetical protein
MSRLRYVTVGRGFRAHREAFEVAAKRHKPYQPAGWDSEEREPAEICATTGKRMYASEAEAQATARHQMAQKGSGALQLRTYRCLYCEAWHLTSKET